VVALGINSDKMLRRFAPNDVVSKMACVLLLLVVLMALHP
jgi:hypothetical protein